MTDVAAIVSVYNCIDLLGKFQNLLATTLAQQERLEIVVVDAKSPNLKDNAAIGWLVEEYPHVTCLLYGFRVPVYAAWNAGIQAAKSPLVVNSNSDDWVTSTAYEEMMFAIRGADVVYGNWCCVTEIGNPKAPYYAQMDFYPGGTAHYANYPFSPSRLADYCHWSVGVMWRKRLHDESGWFDPSFSICGDYDMWCRFTLGGARVVPLPEYLGLWYFDPGGGNISFGDRGQFEYEIRRIRLTHYEQLKAMGNG